ncbi:MAG: hypothetical protein ACRCYX_15725 [Dermatophilaceae bacterium]
MLEAAAEAAAAERSVSGLPMNEGLRGRLVRGQRRSRKRRTVWRWHLAQHLEWVSGKRWSGMPVWVTPGRASASALETRLGVLTLSTEGGDGGRYPQRGARAVVSSPPSRRDS